MLYCLAEAINQRQVPINNNPCVHGGCQFSSNRLRCGWSCGWSVHTDRPVYPPRNWWAQGHGERYGKACVTAQTLWLCRGKPPAGSHYISVLSHGMWIQNCFLCFTLGTCRETANELVQPMTWQCAVLLFIGNDIWCKQKLDDGSRQAPQFSLGCREQGSMTGWCCEIAQCKPRDRRASKSSEAPLPCPEDHVGPWRAALKITEAVIHPRLPLPPSSRLLEYSIFNYFNFLWRFI